MSVPVISVAQMREWETATWEGGQTEAEVIRLVGENLAQHAMRMTRSGDLILILAGKGNNGADARAARENLSDRRVDMLTVEDPATELGKLESVLSLRPALVIDGLFGIGLNRKLDDSWIELIKKINASRARIFSVDVPSGLNADTGEHFGAAIEACATLTVGAPKTGLLHHAASRFVGRLEVATDVGLVSCPHTSELNWTLAEDFSDFPPRRAVAGHKGSFGHLAILGGSLGYHGAAVMTARAAQRARPGLISLFTHETVYHPVAAQLQAVMVHPWTNTTNLSGAFGALLIGPGLAAPDVPDEMKKITRRLWKDSLSPIIVDASALDWLSFDAVAKSAVRCITPHPGEAARLLRNSVQYIEANRPRALREISRKFGNCWVVLKGHQTLIGRSEGPLFVNSSGNPNLAQGGAGDVLAGYLAGLLAQPAMQTDAPKTIRYAVWQHGATADRLETEKPNWIVEDLIEALGRQSG